VATRHYIPDDSKLHIAAARTWNLTKLNQLAMCQEPRLAMKCETLDLEAEACDGGSRTRLCFPMVSSVSRPSDPLLASWLRCHASSNSLNWSQKFHRRATTEKHGLYKLAGPLDPQSVLCTQHDTLGKSGLNICRMTERVKWKTAWDIRQYVEC
jgi:hypothetical protein